MGRKLSLRREATKWFLLGFFAGSLFALWRSSLADPNQGAGNLGASYLGMCHKDWPCEKSLKVFDGLEVKRVGWLHMTFGPPQCPCAQRFLELSGEKEIRVHLTNGTCFKERGRICGPQEPFRSLSILEASRKLERNNPQLIDRLELSWKRLKPLLRKAEAAGVKVYLSPCLECPLSQKARRRMISLASEMFPGTIMVDSVLTQRCLKGSVCEKHGARPRVKSPCLVDTDGISFLDIDISRFTASAASCDIGFLWSRGMNLLPEKKGFIDPRKRKGKDAPSEWEFEAVSSALR
jgi:hypothetical protein